MTGLRDVLPPDVARERRKRWPSGETNVWVTSGDSGPAHPRTRHDSEDRPRFATDGAYLYFTWRETLGDICVMDVVTDEE